MSSALFETTVYLVGQHMAQMAVTGHAAKPMPVRVSAWAVYDVFETRDGEQVFVGIVSDSLWQKFCEAFEQHELWANEDLRLNNQRVKARETLLPQVRELFRSYSKAELIAKLEKTGLPFAPIGRPEDLFDDPHLVASGGLEAVTLPDGRQSRLPILPIEMDGQRLTRGGVLARPGQHTREVLGGLGIGDGEIEALSRTGVIGL